MTNAEYGVLSTVSKDDEPYGVPLNFCVSDEHIYFHCALEGRKIANLQENSRVSFCVVGSTEVMPEKFATKYESTIVEGEAQEVFGKEKEKALKGLVREYAPQFLEKGAKYIKAEMDKTRVFKISINRLSGKARR